MADIGGLIIAGVFAALNRDRVTPAVVERIPHPGRDCHMEWVCWDLYRCECGCLEISAARGRLGASRKGIDRPADTFVVLPALPKQNLQTVSGLLYN